jgi:hypothetical protein
MKHGKMSILFGTSLLLGSLALSGCGSSGKTIGTLKIGSFDALNNAEKGFVEGLKENGFEEGKNITIKSDNANGDGAVNNTMAQSLAASCDLVLGISTTSATALKPRSMGLAVQFRFSSPRRPIRSEVALSPVWISRAATSPAPRTSARSRPKLISSRSSQISIPSDSSTRPVRAIRSFN